MKYLYIVPQKYSRGHEIKEFATAEELTAHVEQHRAKEAILAQRIGLEMRICEWETSAAPPEKEDF